MIQLGLTAASTTDAVIQKKLYGLPMTTLIISNKEMDNIMKILISLEESNLLIKGVSETIENEVKEQKGGFIGTLLHKLGARLLGSMLTVKELSELVKELPEQVKERLGQERILMLPHPLTNFETIK